MIQKKILKIELCSDLCIASGNSHAGVIDQEIVYDEYGFPYIPARRIKGCLREAAELIYADTDIPEMLFGTRGEGTPGVVSFKDAQLFGSQKLKTEIERVKVDQALEKFFASQEILQLFTSTRTQTKIDLTTGIAEENSLRVSRVVNQYHPVLNNRVLRFDAEITYEVSEENETIICNQLECIAKATRNIGMHRNRGLGSVRCTLIDNKTSEKVCDNDDEPFFSSISDEEVVKVTYTLENNSPLILSENNKSDTASFISGKTMLGFMAGAFLRKNGQNAAESDAFKDMFLNGRVIYTNANLQINGNRSFPTPLYINKLKKTEKYVNLLATDEGEYSFDYDVRNGNQPKKLKTWYTAINADSNKYDFSEPLKEMTYHHRHFHGMNDPEEHLYSMEYLSKGQSFIGEIYVPKKYAKMLLALLKENEIKVGKSRSAQYGTCVLKDYKINPVAIEKTYKKGETIVITFKSDAIFVNKDGAYTIMFDEVKQLIAKDLNMQVDENVGDKKSIMTAKEVMGYHTLWKMKKPSVPAISAGSAFVYTLEDDWKMTRAFVGERNLEGYGEVLIQPLENMKYRLEGGNVENETETLIQPVEVDKTLQKMLYQILKPNIVDTMVSEALMSAKNNTLSASNIGRITLMTKECLWNNQDIDKSVNELYKRLESIKTVSVQRNAISILFGNKLMNQMDENKKVYFLSHEKLEKCLQQNESLKKAYEHLSDAQKKSILKEAWGEYILQYLAILKYEKKGEN